MREWLGKRYWLVGASRGLGAALAGVMSRAGVELVLSGRDEAALGAVAAALPGRTTVVPVDVRDTSAVRAAAEAAGAIDGVVYNAGVLWRMPATEWDAGRVEAMLDINLTGAARVMGAVIPGFVARGQGHAVLTGSLAAYRGAPGTIGYGASKAGMLCLAEAMRIDLRGTGIEVQIVNPGFIRTGMIEKLDGPKPFMLEADAAARIMFEHMGTGAFKRSFPGLAAAFVRSGQFLPDWLYERIVPR